jgi:hypothetical protein
MERSVYGIGLCIALERFMGKICLALGYGVCFWCILGVGILKIPLRSIVHLEGRLGDRLFGLGNVVLDDSITVMNTNVHVSNCLVGDSHFAHSEISSYGSIWGMLNQRKPHHQARNPPPRRPVQIENVGYLLSIHSSHPCIIVPS